jgi:hypothetical protein
LKFIRDEYDGRVAASTEFPPNISSTEIRTSLAAYEDKLAAAANRGLCACCGQIVPMSDIQQVQDGHRILEVLNGALDSCKFTFLQAIARAKCGWQPRLGKSRQDFPFQPFLLASTYRS